MNSFRNRLTFFFVIIVIVPMIAVTVILFSLISDNVTGKTDAGIRAHAQTAAALYVRVGTDATAVAKVTAVGTDSALARTLAQHRLTAAARRAHELLLREHLSRIVVLRGGRPVVDVGDRTAIAPIDRDLVDTRGRGLGRLEVSVLPASRYATLLVQLTRLGVVIHRGATVLASTLAAPPATVLSATGVGQSKVRLGGRPYRLVSFRAPGFAGRPLTVSLLANLSSNQSSVSGSRLFAGAFVGVFFLLAFGLAVIVSRSLQRQIEAFLLAARRLASGDFSAQVPTTGRDEFAALGQEFNKMSAELERRLHELDEERHRLQVALRRAGETFASNLDRDALLDIVLRTAVDAVSASAGRASVRGRDGRLEEKAGAGERGVSEREALLAVESAALASARPEEMRHGTVSALAHPLIADGRVVGLVSVVRTDRPFHPEENELFHYLAARAAVSIENVELHERVQRQAVTDELTGLFNHRRFQEAIARELERARRFEQDLGLVLLDIDDFKAVNDNYGHQQGDEVLREVARVIQENSREIDSPARYGGEELAIVLPGTDLDGAEHVAERVREGIEAMRIPRLDGQGEVSVTASAGAACAKDGEVSAAGLIAAADAALYEAKRAGKNRTVRAR